MIIKEGRKERREGEDDRKYRCWRSPHSPLLEINKWNGFNFFFLLSNSRANSNAIIAPKLCPLIRIEIAQRKEDQLEL